MTDMETLQFFAAMFAVGLTIGLMLALLFYWARF